MTIFKILTHMQIEVNIASPVLTLSGYTTSKIHFTTVPISLPSHSGPENLIKSRPKKFVKSNKLISRNCFVPNSIFCNFKIGQKSIFELGKSLKLPTMQFHEKIFFDLFDFNKIFYGFDFTSFFCLDFFQFFGPICNFWVSFNSYL